MLLALILTSCGEKNVATDDSYGQQIKKYESFVTDVANDDISGTIELDTEYAEGYSFFEKEDMPNQACMFYGKSYEGVYDQSLKVRYTSFNADQYQTEDGRFIFYLRSDTGTLYSFSVVDPEAGHISISHKESEDLQAVALSMAETIAKQYLSNIEAYEVKIKPILPLTEDDSTGYRVTYVKKIQGFETSDYLTVAVDGDGYFRSMALGELNGFDAFEETIQFDTDTVDQSILEKVKELYGTTYYQYHSHEITSQKICRTKDGKFGIYSSVFVTLVSETNEVVTGLELITIPE